MSEKEFLVAIGTMIDRHLEGQIPAYQVIYELYNAYIARLGEIRRINKAESDEIIEEAMK